MFSLTRREQFILVAIIAALLVGAAVKHWRASHLSVQAAASSEPRE